MKMYFSSIDKDDAKGDKDRYELSMKESNRNHPVIDIS